MSRPKIVRAPPLSTTTVIAVRPTSTANESRPRSNTESSEDDNSFSIIPVKLSAMANALLNNEPSIIENASPLTLKRYQNHTVATRTKEVVPRLPEAALARMTRHQPPSSSPNQGLDRRIPNDGPKQQVRVVRPPPRPRPAEESSPLRRRASDPSIHTPIVRRNTAVAEISARIRSGSGDDRHTKTKSHRRSQSAAETTDAEHLVASPRRLPSAKLVTPAPQIRRVRIQGNNSSAGFADLVPTKTTTAERSLSRELGDDPVIAVSAGGRSHASSGQRRNATRIGSSTIGRAKQSEETGVQNSMRVKRVGRVAGTFLKGPARRGRRRQSEEDPSPTSPTPPSPAGDGSPVQVSASVGRTPLLFDMSPSIAEKAEDIQPVAAPVLAAPAPSPAPALAHSSSSNIRFAAQHVQQPVYRVPSLPPALPSNHDQENEPPPTFKRGRTGPAISMLSKLGDGPLAKPPPMLATISPPRPSPNRPVLAVRSQNTPHRAAPPPPPPPRMTMLQTATTTAGAETTSQSRKKRSYISLNGKIFTRMDCIGRGGSCRVYQVMAENYKLFALKRVSIVDLDPTTVKGYKGEIDLLRRLQNVDRVVRLIDFEVNDEKQTLSVLMEIGELDLARILKVRFEPDSAGHSPPLDPNFARHYWKEMLECVRAVHAHDIVHSDLKPANFLLVQGRLKLIDFGIANAIQDDTVNVHRDQTVGTPNYMAPEAIQDANAAKGLPSSAGKMMKLGKKSDVWSLGCILYQICYGRPPFAGMKGPVQTIMAITNQAHTIEFPAVGLGGVPVPAGLMQTMRGCLQRDQTKRPAVDELLLPTDPWLYPDAAAAATPTGVSTNGTEGPDGSVEINQETLDKILRNVVRYCQKTPGGVEEEELREWPRLFMEKLRYTEVEARTGGD